LTQFYKFESFVNSPLVIEEKRSFAADVEKERLAFEENIRLYDAQIQSHPINRMDLSSGPDPIGRLALGYANTNRDARDKLNAIRRLHSDLRRGGIKYLQWTQEYTDLSTNSALPWPTVLEVESIRTDDGEVLYPTPKPSSWVYVYIAMYPILGFVALWGLTQAVWWVWSGFRQK
jgi:hypothetical protein